MRRLNLPATTSQVEYIRLTGGLDQITPSLQIKPGYARDAMNFEQSVSGGYNRIHGYERFSGKANPSDANYQTFSYTGALVVGNAITGVTSAATGVVISTDGAIAAITAVSGVFEDGEALNVLGVPVAAIVALGDVGAGVDWGVTQQALAANHYRALISAVPGQGSVLGVFYYQSTVFAFRRNASTTALDLYKSSSSGWVAVPFENEISFSAGTVEYAESSTLSQGLVSATVRRVVLESGTWAGGTAAGRLIIGAVTGGPFVAGAALGGGAVNLLGAESAITMTASGIEQVDTDTYNFGTGSRIYGADGVNRHWEFDGTHLVPISTPVPGQFPKYIIGHQGHLFFSIQSSLFNSGVGLPYDNQAISGAAEILVTSEINTIDRLPGDQTTGALMVGSTDAVQILYGTSAANFRLTTFEDSSGTKPFSTQRMGGQMFAFSNIGVFVIGQTTQYGNFVSNTFTQNIRPWIQARRNLLVGTQINREKSQYRLFFSDNSALYVTFANNKLIGVMPVQYRHEFACICQCESTDGVETGFFGSSDGFVYRMDSGSSFDGESIDYRLVMQWASQGNARLKKRYRHVSFELQGDSYASFFVSYELGYNSNLIEQGIDTTMGEALLSRSQAWDSGVWDQLIWDSVGITPSEIELSGTAENISITIAGDDARYLPFTVNSMVIHYSPRRLIR